ncbi:TPA: hypothetical protein U1344_000679 [Streptococcus suis]|uniref:Accessory secretory protein Asp4 n=1 Tax=Streptococcus suis TaxID=1307 RepID=A0A116LMZ4_STRSU|nr:hypothetical protein [Streptococcus suis]NQH35742.1 hypothetical protein [Streptococcus suis]CYV01502.1 Accessory secretory protein Asp4 [Streptococcus suis]HEM4990291.1 hypothetical protein [Streptococcus suis]HEM5206768.1 hypothetical protein [Streptococcus suis]HEM5227162.1 hypothetical protein [Streptococcus suis]
MKHEHPLKESIDQRLEEERYVIPKKRKEKKRFNFQLIVTISILISLGLIVLQIIQFFFK